MKKILLSLALCMLPCLALQAGSLHNLREQADKYFKQNNLTRSATNDTCTCVMGDEVVALFVEPSSSRFVIMADDNADGMVLGYGNHATDSTSVPPAMRDMLRQCRQLLTLTPTVTTPSSRRLLPQPSYPAVEPMLKTKWTQVFPYNMYCPTYDGSEERCVAGCVATALAQIMNYYRYPAVLQDTLYGWDTEHYSLENVNPDTPIMWDDMQDVYDDHSTFEQQDAVAKLNLYCGMASHMDYGLEISRRVVEAEPFEALERVMGYHFLKCRSNSYTPSNWERLLQQEIQARRPIFLAGTNVLLGRHGFVLDGCDEDGFFHVNWGWGDSCDGYFNLFVLNPCWRSNDTPYTDFYVGFNNEQTAIVMYPDSVTDDADKIETIGNLEQAFQKVNILSHEWGRQPDTNGYTPLTIQLYSEYTDSLICNMAVYCWPLVYDSVTHKIVEQSDSMIAQNMMCLCCNYAILPPNQTLETSSYVPFSESGEYGVGIRIGDLLYPLDNVNVKATVPAQLEISDPQLIENTDTSLTFEVNFTNQSEESWSGDMFTYYLYDSDGFIQLHYNFLNLPPQTVMADTIHFSALNPNTLYEGGLYDSKMNVIFAFDFTTPNPTGVKDVMKDVDPSAPCILYNAQGVLLRRFEQKDMAEQFLNTQCASGVYLLKCGQKVHKVKVK